MGNPRSTEPFEAVLSNPKGSLTLSEDQTKTYSIAPVEPSPCTQACPAGVNVKSYVSLIAAGRFLEALEVVRERNPLPGICGRICTHPCESYCNRIQVDEPVAICWLKRFVADYELTHPQKAQPKPIPRTRKEKIAIIGSGPAGLTAANDLIRKGYGVTIFEALSEPGGMLVAGIPSFRLPRAIIQAEIDAIKQLGVEIKTGVRVEGKKAIEKLMHDGYDAVFIAIGAHKGKKMGIPGENKYKGILDCIDFLNNVNFGKPEELGKKVIVIGGGNSAIDSARTALRLGCEKVHIVYRRSRKEMPANEAEILEAEAEGVKIHFLAAPNKILGISGKITGMECLKMKLGKPDSSGRRRPIPIEGSEFIVPSDTIISAISQEPDLSFLGPDHVFEISKWNTFEVDEVTFATSRPGVFAGGDATTGPSTVIDAIAAGHIATRSIGRYLNGEPLIQESTEQKPAETEIKIDFEQQEKSRRAKMSMVDIPGRKNSFEEVERGFDEAAAIAEAQRCLRCGPCSECFICVPECGKEVIILSTRDGQDERLFRLPPEFKTIDHAKAPWEGILTLERRQFPLSLHPVIPNVVEEICRGCGDCVKICEYSAVTLIPKGNEISVSHIDEDLCRGCGTCVAICPSSAIIPRYYHQQWLVNRLAGIEPEKTNVVVFTCNWNGSHVDGSTFPDFSSAETNVIFIHLMCSGRIEPSFVFRALEAGFDGILIAGCSEETCHYDFGAKQGWKTFEKIRQLTHMLGIDGNRIHYEQIASGDTTKFIKVVNSYLKSVATASAREQKEKVIAETN